MRMLPAVVLATLLLAGCVPIPSPSPTPEPSVTPVFASEEEALAAAGEAYGAYQSAVDLSLTTLETDGLDLVAEGEALDEAVSSVEEFRADGKRLVGLSTTRVVELIQDGGLVTDSQTGELQTYACLDISATDVRDVAGVSVLPPDRITLVPMVVTYIWSSERVKLVVAAADVWGGDDFCV